MDIKPTMRLDDEESRRKEFENIGVQLGVKELDNWYSITGKQVSNINPCILRYYNGSLITALQELYPNHNWNPTRFSVVPRGYWKHEQHQRECLERIGNELGVKQLDDWYNISPQEIMKRGASFIDSYYNKSFILCLQTLYPHHKWNISRFKQVPQSFWRNTENQRQQLEQIATRVGVKELDDWYKVKSRKDISNSCKFISNYYNGNLFKALRTLYPHHHWNTNATRAPSSYWKDINNQKNLMEKIATELGVRQLDDWYKFFGKEVIARRACFIWNYYNGSLINALRTLYPYHEWNPIQFSAVPRGYWKRHKQQQQLHHNRFFKRLGVSIAKFKL